MTLEERENLLNPGYRYHAVLEDGELIGYCCFGEDAQVRGGTYREGELEVGWGMRPDLMGQGRGREFAAAILEYAERTYRAAGAGADDRRVQRPLAGGGRAPRVHARRAALHRAGRDGVPAVSAAGHGDLSIASNLPSSTTSRATVGSSARRFQVGLPGLSSATS